MKKASIDIGSNSILLLVAEVKDGKLVNVIENESRITGLGRNLDEAGEFIKEAIEDSLIALEEYKNICSRAGIASEDIIATATEASRVAKNSKEFFKIVKKNFGIDVTVINGEGEAFYSARGVLVGEDTLDKDIVIMDIGGASTEFIALNEEGEIKYSFSLPVGSIRTTNWLENDNFKSKFEAAVNPFMEKLDNVHAPLLHCVAGTLTSLANMHLKNKNFVENDVHGHLLRMNDVVNLVEKYSSFSPEDFLSNFPFLGKRSHAIRGGLILTKALGELVRVKEFKVSTYGLRYGTLLEGRIEEKYVH